jgi:hypothetical protein
MAEVNWKVVTVAASVVNGAIAINPIVASMPAMPLARPDQRPDRIR